MNLTEQHRLRQLALRSVTLRQLLAIWPAFDVRDIDRSWPAVQESLTALIWLRHRDSAGLAAGYYRQLREQRGVPGTAAPVLAEAPSVAYIDRVLGYVGTIVPKKLIATGRADIAAQTLVHVAGDVGRLVLNGGRDTILGSVRADSRARGWQRITSGNACSFCSMLAGRGAVYGEASADFEAHAHCGCASEPVFD